MGAPDGPRGGDAGAVTLKREYLAQCCLPKPNTLLLVSDTHNAVQEIKVTKPVPSFENTAHKLQLEENWLRALQVNYYTQGIIHIVL